MVKVKKEELLLIKELFNVIIYDEPFIRISSAHMSFIDEEVKLDEIRRELESYHEEVSFLQRSSLFDQLIMERLNRQGTNLFEYIFNSLDRISTAEGKSWNQGQFHKEFIESAKRILYNYLGLSLQEPDLFAYANLVIPNSRFQIEVVLNDTNLAIAYKLLQLSFWRMPADIFMTLLKSMDNYNLILDNILKCLFRKFEQINILDPLVCDILTFLKVIFDEPEFSDLMFRISWAPLIANSSRGRVEDISVAKAKHMEEYSFIGLLFRHSIHHASINQNQQVAYIQTVGGKVQSCKSKGEFQKTIENYNGLYKNYEAKLLALVKSMLKVRPDETFKFLAACIRGNLDKIRLGSMIQNATLNNYSSASFSLTFYDVLLELVKPILAKPELLAKVDTDFIYKLSSEFKYTDTDPVKHLPGGAAPKSMAIAKEFGNSTRFYFYAIECVRLHFVPTMSEILNAFNDYQRMEERVKSLPESHPQKEAYTKRLKLVEQQLIVYRVIIEDKERIRATNDLLNSFLTMFLDWSGNDRTTGQPHPKQELLYYIPSYYLTNTVEFHQIYMNFEKGLTNHVPGSYFPNFNRLIELALTQNLFSNKHHKNKIMELFIFYIMVNKEHMYGIIKHDTTNHEKYLQGLLGYFSEVEFSGEEGAFYSKFKFRSGLMMILDRMWSETQWRQLTVNIRRTEEFNRFVGHIITDLNYCMDEGFQKVPRYKELQSRKGALNEDETNEYSTTKRIIKFSFSMGKDTLKILRLLAEMVPSTFDTDDWRTKFAQVINYYAQKLSTKNFKQYKIDNAKKLGLEPLQMIGDLVNIYVSVADFDTVCKEICEDERSYSDDLLIDLGKTANKYKLVTPEKLGQMENLINKLIELQNTREEMKKLMEDLPEEFTCSLTAEMMKDPVKLPNSHSVVDRKSIKQHIMLNGNSDPFSRQALQLEEVIEMPELKAKIQDWYNKKIAQINLPRKKKVQINTGYEMDEEDLFHAQGEPEVDQGTNPFLSNFNGT